MEMWLEHGKPWTKAEGKLHSIGVSNMTPKMYETLTTDFETKPAVNQVEFNPTFQQKTLRKLLEKDGVVLEAWYPLGHGNKDLLTNPVLTQLAEKYHKNTGQIILRFEIQEGIIPLPKSTNPEHIQTNLDIFDFELTPQEMESIRTLDTGKGTHNPESPEVADALPKAFVIED